MSLSDICAYLTLIHGLYSSGEIHLVNHIARTDRDIYIYIEESAACKVHYMPTLELLPDEIKSKSNLCNFKSLHVA